jgi:hypothetical protein
MINKQGVAVLSPENPYKWIKFFRKTGYNWRFLCPKKDFRIGLSGIFRGRLFYLAPPVLMLG